MSVVIILAFLLIPGQLTGAESKEEWLKKIGPLISREEAPEHYALFDRWGTALAKAVNEYLTEKTGVPHNHQFEWHISNDLSVNASFQVVSDNRGSHVAIVVNRGLILEAFEDARRKGNDLAPVEIATKRVLGAFQHEFAHALDKFDPEGIDKRHGSESEFFVRLINRVLDSQAIELKTDALAMDLAYRANQPRDAIYQTQIFLKEKSQAPGSLSGEAFKAYLSTHPATDVRIGAARLGQVATRFQRGVPIPDAAWMSTTLDRDLPVLRKGTSWNIDFKKYHTLDEALTAMEKFRDPRRKDNWNFDAAYHNDQLQFAHARLSFQEILKKKGSSLTPEERKRVALFLSDYNNNKLFYPLEATQFFKNAFQAFPPGHPGYDLHSYEASRDYLADLVNDPEFVRVLREKMLPDVKKRLSGDLVNLELARGILGETGLFTVFEPEITAFLKKQIEQPTDYESKGFQSRSETYSRWLFEKVYPRLSESDRIALHIDLKRRQVSQRSLFQVTPGTMASYENVEAKLFPKTGVADPQLTEFARRQAAYYWANRGKYGVLDFLGGDLNWPLIWKVLGVDPAEGRTQLNDAIRKFTEGPDYLALLREFPTLTSYGRPVEYKISTERPIDDLRDLKDADLLEHLRGNFNPHFKDLGDRARTVAKRYIAGTLIASRPDLLKAELFKALGGKQIKPTATPDEVFAIIDEAMAKVYDFPSVKAMHDGGNPGIWNVFHDVFLKLVESHPQKPRLLAEFFMRTGGYRVSTFPYAEMTSRYLDNPELLRRVGGELIRNKVIPNFYSLFKENKVPPKGSDAHGFVTVHHVIGQVAPSIPVLDDELKTLPLNQLDDFFRAVFEELKHVDPKEKRDLNNHETALDMLSGQRWDRIKSTFFARLKESDLTLSRKLEMYRTLAGIGPSHDSDEFLLKELLPAIRRLPGSERDTFTQDVLRRQLVWNQKLAFGLAKKYLQARAQEVFGKATDINAVREFSKYVEEILPGSSSEKDDFIESLAWTHRIDTKPSLSELERLKSTHPSNLDPRKVNMLSSASAVLDKLTPEEAAHLFEYLLNPSKQEFPESIITRLEGQMRQEARARREQRMDRSHDSKMAAIEEKEIQLTMRATRDSIQRAAFSLTREQRLPIFEMLMHASSQPMIKEGDFPLGFIRKYLNYPHDSNDEKILVALLETFKPEEAPGVLAYLVSRNPTQARDMVKTLTLFGTPGKKFAQLAGLWNLFPAETERLNRVKDNAEPMDKIEILRLLEKQVSPSDFAKIDHIEEILGAASIKTSVRIHLRDGSLVVASVVNPDAEGQIRTHFATVRAMLPKLRAANVPGAGPSTERAIDLAEAQALGELDMVHEAGKVDRVGTEVTKLATEMKSQLGRWRLNVPKVSSSFGRYKGVLFTELANGTTLNRAKASSDTHEAGKIASEVILALYFRAGVVVSDPHRGNLIVDLNAEHPTLHFIDHGQNLDLSDEGKVLGESDVSRFTRFLLALNTKNPAHIAEAGADLSKMRATPEQIGVLTKVIQKSLSEEPNIDRLLLRINQEFFDAGIPIEDRFSFNTLKAFTTLLQEKYVTPEEFLGLVKTEVTGHVMRNLGNAGFMGKCMKYLGALGGSQ